MKLILASSSASRKRQLSQLKVAFSSFNPDIDETALAGESADNLVLRLAKEKAYAAAIRFREHVIVAGDQVHLVGDTIHGKPGNYETAFKQLTACSGQTTAFVSGISVLNTATGQLLMQLVTTKVKFKELSCAQIEKYLQLDRPYECAGSIRIEGLAPCLIDEISTPDPTAITGMPLVVCCDMLRAAGFDCLEHADGGLD